MRRVLVADSASSRVFLQDRTADRVTWQRSLFGMSSRAHIVQAIALPGGRVVTATNWEGAGVSGLDLIPVFAPDDGQAARRRIASAEHQDAPEDLVIEPALEDLRDVVALEDDTLVVTTRLAILGVTLQGQVLWRAELADYGIGGQLASARVTPEGRLVAATFEPGRWTSPHPNHRVHWFELPELPSGPIEEPPPGDMGLSADPDMGAGKSIDADMGQADEAPRPRLLASSAPLERAPRRIEPRAGTGGTGARGYDGTTPPGQDPGSLEELIVGSPLQLERVDLRPGQRLRASVELVNAGGRDIELAALELIAYPGGSCLEDPAQGLRVAAQPARALAPLERMPLTFERVLDEAFGASTSWCAQLLVTRADPEQTQRQIGNGVLFEVRDVDPEMGTVQLPTRDLGVVVGAPPDMGPGPDGGAGMDAPSPMLPVDIVDPEDPERGCACGAASGGQAPAGGLAALALLGLARLGRPRRRRR